MMKVTFWGVRGSIPTPMTSGQLRQRLKRVLQTATTQDLRDESSVDAFLDRLPFHLRGTYGGNTACVELAAGGETIILDAGSGIRPLGLSLMRGDCGKGKGIIHIFLSHTHWDHIQGFPFFVPAYVPGNQITFHSSCSELEKRLVAQQFEQYFPVPLAGMGATIRFHQVHEGQPFRIGDVEVTSFRLYHPNSSFAYRFRHEGRTLVYASDAEFNLRSVPFIKRCVEFTHDADCVVFDTQYTAQESFQKLDWGHSSAPAVIDIARKAGIKKIVLFHHEPAYDDEKVSELLTTARDYLRLFGEEEGQDLEALVAYEGLEIEV